MNGKQKQTSQGRGKKKGAAEDIKRQVVLQKKLRSKGKYDEESLIGRKTKDGRALGESAVKYGGFFKELS